MTNLGVGKEEGGGEKRFIIACSRFEHKKQTEKKVSVDNSLRTEYCQHHMLLYCNKKHPVFGMIQKRLTLSCINEIKNNQYLSSQCSNFFLKCHEPSDLTRFLFCS